MDSERGDYRETGTHLVDMERGETEGERWAWGKEKKEAYETQWKRARRLHEDFQKQRVISRVIDSSSKSRSRISTSTTTLQTQQPLFRELIHKMISYRSLAGRIRVCCFHTKTKAGTSYDGRYRTTIQAPSGSFKTRCKCLRMRTGSTAYSTCTSRLHCSMLFVPFSIFSFLAQTTSGLSGKAPWYQVTPPLPSPV